MKRILLLGAGFSRNWGGLLANEMFDSLLAQPEIAADPELARILWAHQDSGGFENALAQIQQDFRNNGSVDLYGLRLQHLQSAIDRVFAGMDQGFATMTGWDFSNDRERTIVSAFAKFDALGTLNQDLLFERFYFNDNVMLEAPQRWGGVYLPGMRETRGGHPVPYDPSQSIWTPLPATEFKLEDRMQPYFKLHGSWRWTDRAGEQLMVMGGNKALIINGHPVLAWYQKEFERLLSGDVKLVVIGYGFGDQHINETLLRAGAGGGLKMFVVDPLGAHVTHPDRHLRLKGPNPFQSMIGGVSRRSLREIFGSDAVAHGQLMQFLAE